MEDIGEHSPPSLSLLKVSLTLHRNSRIDSGHTHTYSENRDKEWLNIDINAFESQKACSRKLFDQHGSFIDAQ